MDYINNRYRIEKHHLDVDSESKHFVVFDEKDKQRKILRLFNSGVTIEENDEIFENYLKYARSRHKNVLANYNLDVLNVASPKKSDLQFFYTKEYIDSTGLIDYCSLGEEDRLFVLESVLYALTYLHFKGVVYGNLSFSKLFISKNRDGSLNVKLDDLASVIFDRESKRSMKHESMFRVSGMESYKLSFQADIFSLGMMTYYLVTGKDYRIETMDYLGMQQIPEQLAQLISNSIHINPGKRPKSVLEFWTALSQIYPIGKDFVDREYYESLDFSSSFIVHKEKIELILEDIGKYFEGEGQNTTFVRSKKGMGKSRFLSEIRHFARLKGFNPIMIEAKRSEEDVYENFSRLLRQILSSFSVSSLVIEKYGKDLAHLVPEYQQKWGISADPICDKSELRNRIISRLMSLVEKLSSDYKFVIIIDNVDMLSKEEVYILSSLIKSHVENLPYLLLSAGDMPTDTNDWVTKEEYRTIELKPFNYHDTVNHLKKLFNIEGCAQEIAKGISGICHGNPSRIENVLFFLYKIGKIRMTEERVWEIRLSEDSLSAESLQGIELYDLDLQAFRDKVSLLSEDAIYILKQLSVFSQQMDVFFALQFSGLGGKRFMAAIDELIEKNIIFKISSDWGNYYEFFDYRLSNIFYYEIDRKEKIRLHREIAKYYKDKDFIDYEAEFDSYVLHLIRSEQPEKAINALKEKAEKKSKDYLFNEAIEYYEYAISITDPEKMPTTYISILQSISDVYSKLGLLREAEEYYFKLIKVSKELNYSDIMFMSYEEVIELFIFQNRIAEAEAIIEEIKHKLENYSNETISIRFRYFLLKLAHRKGDTEKFLRLSAELMDYLELISNDYYLALVMLEKAKYYLDVNDSESALKNAESALELFYKKSENEQNFINVYRVLGCIAFKKFDYSSGERHFMHAYQMAKEIGNLWQNAKLLIDMGTLYMYRFETDQARDYFEQAEKFASLSNQIDAIMMTSLNLIKLSISTEDYSLARLQYDKYVDLFEENKNGNLKHHYYYHLLIASKLFLDLKIFKLSENLLKKVEESNLEGFDGLKSLQVDILKAELAFFKHLMYGEEFSFELLNKVLSQAYNRVQVSQINEFFLDLALDAYLNEKWDIFEYAYAKLRALNVQDPNISSLYRMEFFADLRERDEEKLQTYIRHINYDQFTYSWKIFTILADLQFDKEKYVNALVNYIEARGQFLDRMRSVPISYRDKRMDMDVSLKKIDSRISQLAKLLYDIDFKIENVGIEADKELGKEQEKRLKKLIGRIISDKDYKKYYEKVYENKLLIYIESWQKYISSMDEDSRANLEKLIKFLTEYSMAEYGCFVVVGSNGEVNECFSTDYSYDPGVHDYIYSRDEKKRFYLENKSWNPSIGSSAGLESTKMFFPIYLNEKNSLYTRRLDDEDEFKELMGYVYLESRKVIHNITPETYKKIIAYEPLLALVANDYVINKKVSVDNLTQAHLRVYVQDTVQKTIEKTKGVNLHFSVLMIDIDHFKDVNDSYGHSKGDEVLRSLAGIIMSTVRESDIVGRYGGEEFIVILNGISREHSKQVAEKIRFAVDKAKLLGDDRPLTISIGSASYPDDGRNLDILTENADKALYHSKNNGRNMVSLYNSDIAKSNLRYDTLAGVFGINQSEDNRRMNAIIEIMNLSSQGIGQADMLKEILSRITDIVEAKEVALILSDGRVYSSRSGDENLHKDSLLPKKKLASLVKMEDGFFVDWAEESYNANGRKIANWNNYILSELVFKGVKFGKILLFSTIREHEFERHHYKFVSSVSSIVASVIKDI